MSYVRDDGADVSLRVVAAAAPDLSVCILNYNTVDCLRACLTSVLNASTSFSCEIIVVDNASSDGSAEMVRREFPGVQLIANSENRYFARGNNQAFRVARGRFILVLNPDTIVPAAALERMIAFMKASPRVGVAGAALRLSDGSLSLNGWKAPNIHFLLANQLLVRRFASQSRFRREALMLDWDRRSSRRVDVVMGSFLMIRHEVLDQIGFFDEGYLLYYTDDELCRRISRAGWEVWYVADVEVAHAHQQSSRKSPKLKILTIHLLDSLRYFWQHQSRLAVIPVAALLLIDLAVKALFYIPLDAWRMITGRKRSS